MLLLPATDEETESSQGRSLVPNHSADLAGMRFELLSNSGARALSSGPDYIETQHSLENGAFWAALSAGVQLLDSRARVGPALMQLRLNRLPVIPKGVASVETRMLSVYFHFKHLPGCRTALSEARK